MVYYCLHVIPLTKKYLCLSCCGVWAFHTIICIIHRGCRGICCSFVMLCNGTHLLYHFVENDKWDTYLKANHSYFIHSGWICCRGPFHILLFFLNHRWNWSNTYTRVVIEYWGVNFDTVPLKHNVALARLVDYEQLKKSLIKGAWHSSRSQVFIPFLVAWMLAKETSAMPHVFNCS